MSKYTLLCEDTALDGMPVFEQTFVFETDVLEEAIMYLDMFLKGSGFVYSGELGVISDERA